MKKKRIIILFSVLMRITILFSILAATFVIGYFVYSYFTASAVKDGFYHSFISGNEDIERLSRLPEQIELGTGSKPGYIVHFQDYSLTLSGYDEVVIDGNFDDNSITLYHIDDKFIMFRDAAPSKNDFIYNDPTLSSWIEKAAGKKINSEYGYMEASFYCTPENFSLFDANKNKGVVWLLGAKEGHTGDTCYQFDNEVIKGFINVITPDEAIVAFSDCKVPDSYYQLIFTGFSTEEVKEMLGTIAFDGGNANQ